MSTQKDAPITMQERHQAIQFPALDKREYFSAMAMQGLLSKSGYMERNCVATDAVTLADNLLAALEKAP